MGELREVEANGVRFACLDEGEGPLVLLLHGFPDTAHTWDRVRPALARAGYRAVSPFMRGYAPTAIPRDGKYDLETLGRDVLALIAALGAERAVVVGHDWGAAAAYAAGALDGARLTRLITLAVPHPLSVLPTPRALWAARHIVRFQSPRAAAAVRADDFALIDELVRRWSPAWAVPAGETAAVKRVFRHPGCLDAALGYYRAILRLPPRWLRGRIGVPATVFRGRDDGIFTAGTYERARRWFDGDYEVVTLPGGHFLHREHPDAFLTALTRVLASA